MRGSFTVFRLLWARGVFCFFFWGGYRLLSHPLAAVECTTELEKKVLGAANFARETKSQSFRVRLSWSSSTTSSHYLPVR